MDIRVEFPDRVRCTVALSYDLEMCAGYSPVGINHGRIMAPVQDYALRLCQTAEEYSVQLHFFHVGNGLEEDDVGYLEEILRRGHVVDSHTYSHLRLGTPDSEKLHAELELTNHLLSQRLGWTSTVLRGPGGEANGLNGLEDNQRAILKNGFRWVTCHKDVTMGEDGLDYDAAAPSRLQAYSYATGLIELPIQGWLDRSYFDSFKCVDQVAYDGWRAEYGHEPVPSGWKCPWTDDDALDGWIEYNLAALDFAYENELLWVPTWHPYSHYLHDPQNRMLPALLERARSKPEKVHVGTVRDAVQMLRTS